jgi:hypothetical protein
VVKPQVDVQGWLANLRLQPWHRHQDWARPTSSASLWGTMTSGVIAWGATALSASPKAQACRWRPLDLARARGNKFMAALLAADKLVRCISMRVVELTERGAHAASGSLLLGGPAEENETCPLQGLRNLGGVDDAVERCAQVHDGDVRGFLL